MPVKEPTYKKVDPSFGRSFNIREFKYVLEEESPSWHFHPEIELVAIVGGNGKRHIGNNISWFEGGDVLMIGPNLPHMGFTNRLTGKHSEIVVQLKPDFLGKGFMALPELRSVAQLFDRSKRGIVFQGATKDRVMKGMLELTEEDTFTNLIKLLRILQELATTIEYEVLNGEGPILEVQPEDVARMQKIYSYVKEHYGSTVTTRDVSDIISMTEPSFCRYFKKQSGKPFKKFLNEYRVVQATRLLRENDLSLREIAFECGFNDQPYFTKKFKEIVGKSPARFVKTIDSPE